VHSAKVISRDCKKFEKQDAGRRMLFTDGVAHAGNAF